MHDWTLIAAHIDWIGKLVEFKLRDEAAIERVLRFEVLEEVTLDCRDHWGPSNSVNTIALVKTESLHGCMAKIEMQSGGSLVVTASVCYLDGVPFDPALQFKHDPDRR